MTPARRISSRSTVVVKRVYPILFVAGVVLIFAMPLIGALTSDQSPPLWFLIPAGLLVFVVGWLIMKKLISGLVDEVFDEGDALLVKNNHREERIALSDIAGIRYGSLFNPGKVTVILRKPGIFGAEIGFLPPTRFFPFAGSPVIRDLTKRIDAQRAG
jgi:hypothetical protein